MQAITHISPAIAAFFYTQFVVSLAGITAPLAYTVGFLLVLMLGNSLVQLSKHLPSAGGYYTYVSRAIHPRAGFITSWMYILYSPLCGGPIYGFFGFITAGALKSYYDIDVPWLWWVCILVGAPFVAFLQHQGIKISTRTMLVLGGFELSIVFLLALSGFLNPGDGGVSLQVFNPANIAAISGFTLAIVFSVQGLTGWEAAAPLAEETQNPRRNVPISVIASITLIGIFLVFVFWGVITYFGINTIDNLISSSQLPALAMAQDLWGAGWLILLFAFLNSVIAVCLATANVGTRMWYAMARSGSFPKVLAKVEPVRKTPTNAILLQMTLSLVGRPGRRLLARRGRVVLPDRRPDPGARRDGRLPDGQPGRVHVLPGRAPRRVQLAAARGLPAGLVDRAGGRHLLHVLPARRATAARRPSRTPGRQSSTACGSCSA